MADLPTTFASWFAARGWRPHRHQLDLLTAAQESRSALLVAPTGGGKTLAGFLPSLVALAAKPAAGLHTVYVSPLKALAADVHRNLERPIVEMALPVRHEVRTGDTAPSTRQAQKSRPPNILLTTPESLSLLLATAEAPRLFRRLACVIIDELHALVGTKRGDLLSLSVSRLRGMNPGLRCVGLSATVADPPDLARHVAPDAIIVQGAPGPDPKVEILTGDGPLPWSGHTAKHAAAAVMDAIRAHRTTIVFSNTRAQAEIIFQNLWKLNEESLPIGLHHGSLSREARLKVEAAMAAGALRAVVATSSLDLGIDWGDVDLVIQIGAPKGSARLVQRVGRANHRLDEPSRALLVPGNRFEALEARAAIEAMAAHELDRPPARQGGLDVLAQHILGTAVSGPFDAEALYAEATQAAPYAGLAREEFDRVLAFVADGGYVLSRYERYQRLTRLPDGRWRLAHPRLARQYRLNAGVIIEAPLLKVRLRRGPFLGEIEEDFVATLTAGDTFIFGGQVLRYDGLEQLTVVTSKAEGREPKIPAYAGGRMPLSSELAARVLAILDEPSRWPFLPGSVAEWIALQARRSRLPRPGRMLLETFPRRGRNYLVAYGFAGRNAHQTLGLLLTRRLERRGLGPLGFVANDYAVATWALRPAPDPAGLFGLDLLADELEDWLAGSNLFKRAFRHCAIIGGLIQREHGGSSKTMRQVTVNSDLIYDVLRQHEPDHVLLRAARADAMGGLIDLARLEAMLAAVQGRIDHVALDHVSPLSVPVLLDLGKESTVSAIADDFLDAAAEELIAEAEA